MKVVVIGGGPAGIMSSIYASKYGHEVVLLEKMESLGKKLLITGKGRCNITSSLDMSEFIQNIPGNGRFLFSCFQNFTNNDIITFMKKHGVEVKQERGNRIFPSSDKAQDVLNAFYEELKEQKVKIYLNSKVNEIVVSDGKVIGVKYTHNGSNCTIEAEKVIIATGGKSYPATGSTGDGYEMVEKLGHTITDITPSLIPIVANDNNSIETIDLACYRNSKNLCKVLQGLSLKNVKIQFEDIKKKKVIYEDFGELLFTHFGVSGPTVLSSSAHIIRYKDIKNLLLEGKIVLKIDFKPALDNEKLDSRILRDFEKEKNKLFKNSLNDLLPQKLIDPIIELTKINPNKKVNEISKVERQKLVNLLKNFTITISGFRPVNEAIVTAGGVNIKEINPKTMESKIVNGLFFAGEVIDVDAYTGGFNLQIAYSTGATAGSDIKNN